jgi:hypothetical protein
MNSFLGYGHKRLNEETSNKLAFVALKVKSSKGLRYKDVPTAPKFFIDHIRSATMGCHRGLKSPCENSKFRPTLRARYGL